MNIVSRICLVLFLMVLSFFGAAGCTSARWASLKSLGSKHHVELYNGGKKIAEWTSTGVVANQDSSDGYHFQDDSTGLNVEISGTVIITQL